MATEGSRSPLAQSGRQLLAGCGWLSPLSLPLPPSPWPLAPSPAAAHHLPSLTLCHDSVCQLAGIPLLHGQTLSLFSLSLHLSSSSINTTSQPLSSPLLCCSFPPRTPRAAFLRLTANSRRTTKCPLINFLTTPLLPGTLPCLALPLHVSLHALLVIVPR